MELQINGSLTTLDRQLCIRELLERLGIHGRVAIEINGDIVPRSRFDSHTLQPGDAVEIVRAIGGG